MIKLPKVKPTVLVAIVTAIVLIAGAATLFLIRRHNQQVRNQDPNAAILYVPTKQSEIVQRAQFAADSGKPDEAKTILADAISATRNSDDKKEYNRALFKICVDAEDSACAIEAVKALDETDINTTTKVLLARMYDKAGQKQAAVDMYKKALAEMESAKVESGAEEEQKAGIANVKAQIARLEDEL